MRTPVLAFACVALVAGDVLAQPGRRGPRREKQQLLPQFDADRDGKLDRKERDAARAWLKENRQERRRGPGRRRGPRGGEDTGPREPGPKVEIQVATTYSDRELYDPFVLRHYFLTFEHDDWEEELSAFRDSDVEVPATLVVDGVTYEGVGLHFRGNTSYSTVAPGRRRSLNVAVDFSNPESRLRDYKTLNLLNGHADPSMMREVLHAYIGRQFCAVPRASFAHVVINGRSWGIYANVQQQNREFADEAFGSRKGARWHVSPNFSGNGGLRFLGDDPAEYRDYYTAKSGVDDAAWQRLVDVCRLLSETTVEERRKQLPEYLDIDGALWFLAIDNALVDGDGYLTRASDYVLMMDAVGVFHVVTHDNNEILGAGGGGRGGPPGGRRGPPPAGGESDGRGDRRGGRDRGDRRRGGRRGGRGPRISPTQSPLAGADNAERPLIHYLLEVPEWRARYLAFAHSLAADGLDWQKLGPVVERMHGMIGDVMRSSTRNLYGIDRFEESVDAIRQFAETRRKAMLEHESLAGAWPRVGDVKHVETGEGKKHGLLVTAEMHADVPVESARLYWQKRRPGAFEIVPMQRGADGVFSAEIPPQKPGEKIHYYVEATAAGDTGRLAFAPAGASAKPWPYRFAGKKKQKTK